MTTPLRHPTMNAHMMKITRKTGWILLVRERWEDWTCFDLIATPCRGLFEGVYLMSSSSLCSSADARRRAAFSSVLSCCIFFLCPWREHWFERRVKVKVIQEKEGNATCVLFKQIFIYRCGRTFATMCRIQSVRGSLSNFLLAKIFIKRLSENWECPFGWN